VNYAYKYFLCFWGTDVPMHRLAAPMITRADWQCRTWSYWKYWRKWQDENAL